MTLHEFVKLKANEIRRDKGLMQLYVDFYEAAFSLKPNCIGCSFKSGLKKLRNYAKLGEKTVNLVKKSKPMKTKSFIVKKQYQLKILTYKKDGVTHRKYGHSLDEEFARELVKAGKGEVFAKLPGSVKEVTGNKKSVNESASKVETGEVKEVEKTNYTDMDYRTELLPLYNEIKDRTGKSAVGKSKQDIIEFLEDQNG